jgi:NDP-sugar pyrophosphorylase family protein
MTNGNEKTLCLVLAAGIGRRVRYHLTDSEKIKQMMKVRSKRLIEHLLDELAVLPADIAVLSQDSHSHGKLNKLLNSRDTQVLFQKAPNWHVYFLLQLPLILFCQYYLSTDRKFLRTYDSIVIFPSDLLFTGIDFYSFLSHHWRHARTQKKPVVSLLSKRHGTGGGKCYFRTNRTMVIDWRLKPPNPLDGYQSFIQSGVYAITRSILDSPMRLLWYRTAICLTVFDTSGDWIDYGDPENIKKLRENESLPNDSETL